MTTREYDNTLAVSRMKATTVDNRDTDSELRFSEQRVETLQKALREAHETIAKLLEDR